MNTGKTLFAQLMDFLPWTTFTRIVDRYGGDHRVRTLSCAEQYRSMAFAQLTYRESLRDIETCLSVHASKLYHMGFRQPVRRSTLADANERRDWRIHAALAQRLITQARTLYVDEELGLDLTNTVYALDSTTIALCLSVFPWAHFRTTKAAVKMHTLLDLRGNIPSFIHISDGKLHDVHALDMLLPEAGAIYVVDRGYVDFARLYVLHQAGAFFVTRAKSNIDAHRVYSAPTDRSTGIICDQTISLDGFYTRQDYPELLRRIRFKDPESGKTLVFITNNFSLPAATICALYKSRWQVELFFKWIKQHLRIKQFYGTSENAVKTQIWIAVSVYVLVAIVKKRLDLDASLYTLLQIRRNFLVPMPRFRNFDDLNTHLEACCAKRWAEQLRGHDQTVGERLERDRAVLQRLPAIAYDACDKRPGRVSSLSLVRYRGTDYSVPTRFGHCEVLVRGYVHEVVISCAAEVIARHPRSYEQEDFVFDPLHYLSLLEQKTNALDQAAPLAGWLLPPVFGDLRRLLEARMGKAGKREYVQVLRLIESFSLDDVRAAISEALERGVIGFDAVKHLVLCRIEKRPPRLNLLAHPYLPRAEVATTSARSYMGLLKGAAP